MYVKRQLIDGRSHESRWSSIFTTAEEKINKNDFVSRLNSLPYQMCLGPPSSVPVDESPTTEALDAFWNILISEQDDKSDDMLCPEQAMKALKKRSAAEHGMSWTDWIKAWS
eukprot:CAMPEP_0182427550 /NCGR_PEP_ID=MMETSP1167-20130531/18350_1 /TAXON_ID=2988 /ORGANISM="Mallomonas Sp, Strain CCMP3275" /LENGTH=111 /DNA_ID=CAMNT_0024609863 /DNA_START=424 /DNA_END=759 /DNA_ORIENTATION=+